MIELKPCPECGGEFATLHKKRDKYRYECDDCCWTTAYHWYLTEEEAAAAWNKLERKKQTGITDELKTCPFCGAEAELNYKQALNTWIVECSNSCCPASYMIGMDYDTEAEAIEAWNRRAEDV